MTPSMTLGNGLRDEIHPDQPTSMRKRLHASTGEAQTLFGPSCAKSCEVTTTITPQIQSSSNPAPKLMRSCFIYL